jgi:serine/threonine protein kinase
MRFGPGARIGHYEIVAPLGSGGMGEVYRVHDPKLERDVAAKDRCLSRFNHRVPPPPSEY